MSAAQRLPWWAEEWFPTWLPDARPVLVATLKASGGGHGLVPRVLLEVAPGWRTGPEEVRSVQDGPLESWTWTADYRPAYRDTEGVLPWVWEIGQPEGGYRDLYHVRLSRAQAMAKALGRIAAALERKRIKEGPADRPALWIPRLAQALGTRNIILERLKGPEPDRRPWLGMGPDTMRRTPAEAGTHLEKLAHEVRALRLPSTLPEEVQP